MNGKNEDKQNMTGLSEGSRFFKQYLIINMENTMKTITYIFIALKCVIFCVLYMTFYSLHNSVKLPSKMQKMAVQGL